MPSETDKNNRTRLYKQLDNEVSISSLIYPALAISIARTTKGNNSKGPGPMAFIFFPTIQLVIPVICRKFQVISLTQNNQYSQNNKGK